MATVLEKEIARIVMDCLCPHCRWIIDKAFGGGGKTDNPPRHTAKEEPDYMEEFRRRLSPKEELRNSLEAVKSDLQQAQSWIFTHPEVWSKEFADEFRELVRDVIELIDELISRAYEEAEEHED